MTAKKENQYYLHKKNGKLDLSVHKFSDTVQNIFKISNQWLVCYVYIVGFQSICIRSLKSFEDNNHYYTILYFSLY